MHTFTFENQLFFNKTHELNFNLPRDLADQFLKFHENREFTSVPAEKICSFSNFFRWPFQAGKVGTPGLPEFFSETN